MEVVCTIQFPSRLLSSHPLKNYFQGYIYKRVGHGAAFAALAIYPPPSLE